MRCQQQHHRHQLASHAAAKHQSEYQVTQAIDAPIIQSRKKDEPSWQCEFD